ncbi:MAG TPA: potassium channel protein [Thermoanaerobaculaceae bacterium]|nr:potassium channel protein [Thermoanaerobaculaceae bacterium]
MRSRLARAGLFLAGVFAAGTIGYRLIEHVGWWDAFYMTVMVLTTVGSNQTAQLSRPAEVFTVVLLVAGLGMILLVATELGRSVLEGELREAFGQVRRSRMIESLSGHEIVCGWGRMGQAVVDELRRARHGVVVVEAKPEKVQRLHDLEIPVVAGDATREDSLRAAGIERARGLVACLNDDAHNVYTVLTARSLNPELFIVARAGEEGAEGRMLRAGANRVVNPYQHGGARLAHLVVKPTVVDFLDFSLGSGEVAGLDLEQVRLAASSPLVGSTLAEADLRRKCGVGVVAVQRRGALLPNPEPNLALLEGDVLVVLGARVHLEEFEKMFCTGPAGKEA